MAKQSTVLALGLLLFAVAAFRSAAADAVGGNQMDSSNALPPESFGDHIGSDDPDATEDAAPVGSAVPSDHFPPVTPSTDNNDGQQGHGSILSTAGGGSPADDSKKSGGCNIRLSYVVSSVALIAGMFSV